MNSYCSGSSETSDCRMNLEFSSNNPMELKFGVKVVPVIGEVTNYNNLSNKPKINGVELIGDKRDDQLKIVAITNEEIEDLLNAFA